MKIDDFYLTDKFLDMPASARFFYLVLERNADEDNIIHSHKAIMRLCGASEGDLELLIDKCYIEKLDNGTLELVV